MVLDIVGRLLHTCRRSMPSFYAHCHDSGDFISHAWAIYEHIIMVILILWTLWSAVHKVICLLCYYNKNPTVSLSGFVNLLGTCPVPGSPSSLWFIIWSNNNALLACRRIAMVIALGSKKSVWIIILCWYKLYYEFQVCRRIRQNMSSVLRDPAQEL